MKKKRFSTGKKVNRRHDVNAPGPVVVFFITLGAVLVLGTAGMFLWNALGKGGEPAGQAGMASASGSLSNEDGDVLSGGNEEADSLWEKIPEEWQKEQEENGQQEGSAKESRYGDVLQDAEYMEENHIIPWEGNEEGVVTLGFVGDILLDDEYAILANLLNRGGTIENGISAEMLDVLQSVDILVANNEFPFTSRGTPTEGKTYTFRAEPDTVAYLHDMGVDLAVLANNHMFDFGEQGLLDTLDTLSDAGIPYIGAGRNLEEAATPVYYIVNDIKIAVVAATQIERLDNPDTRGAGENISGVFRCLDPTKLYEVVGKAKAESDFVIVYMHWGTENVAEPDWAQLDQASGLADAGADLIIGDHPHCLQGIAYYGDVPVIYSLGNFWFNSKTVDTGMVQVEIDAEGLKSFRFVPAIQSDCRVNLASGTEKERILAYMRELSPEVNIDSEGYVTK